MRGSPKKTPKKRKATIISAFPGTDGPLGGVVYSDGRVLLFTYTKQPNKFDKNPSGEGFWSELNYPDLDKVKESRDA
jgi:hypothetical protein